MGAYGKTPNTELQIESALDAVVLTADTNGIEIDTKGFDGGWLTFIVNVGTVTGAGATLDITAEETDVTGFGGTVTAITGAAMTQIIQSTAGTFNKTLQGTIQILGRQRFIRLVFDEGVAITACPISAVYVLQGPRDSAKVTTTYEYTVTG